MKKKDMPFIDRILLRKRAVIESVNDSQESFSDRTPRHRSLIGMINCVFSALLHIRSIQPNQRWRN